MQSRIALVNGNLLTMDDQKPLAEAVLIENGMIVKVGDTKEIKASMREGTESIDLKGKTVLPGFIESHAHPMSFGVKGAFELDCRSSQVKSIKELQEKLASYSKTKRDQVWIHGFGWNEQKFLEKRRPTRWDLDEVVSDRPVVLRRTCHHISVLNSKALELCGIDHDTPDPHGGRIVRDPKTKEPTGILEERANELVPTPEYDLEDTLKGIEFVQNYLAKRGITTVHEAIVNTPEDYHIYQHLLKENGLDLRFRLWFWAIGGEGRYGFLDPMIDFGMKSGFGHSMLNVQGSKFMIDGAGSGKTAAVYEPYVDDPNNYGLLLYDEQTMIQEIKRSIEHGLRVAVHAIGDHAMEIALKSFEAVEDREKVRKMRNRIEHCVLPLDDHFKRMKDLNIIASSSSGFIYQIGDNYYHHLGPERAKKMFPHRSFIDHGIVAPGNSDLPVTDGNPFEGIYGLVNRKTDSGIVYDETENITVTEALKAYTIDAAYAGCEEDQLGSISENKLADLIVVSENPLEVEKEALKDLEVELTMVHGKVVYTKEDSNM